MSIEILMNEVRLENAEIVEIVSRNEPKLIVHSSDLQVSDTMDKSIDFEMNSTLQVWFVQFRSSGKKSRL